MKTKTILKILMLFAVLANSKNMRAQPFQSIFGKDSTAWTYCYYGIDGYFLNTSKIIGDTVFDGLNWKIVSVPYILTSGTDSVVYLSEDTMNGKIWRYQELQSPCEKRLIMDMQLGVGDYMLFNDYDCSSTDTLFVENIHYSLSKKIIKLRNLNQPFIYNPFDTTNQQTYKGVYFIEGIGPSKCFGFGNSGFGIWGYSEELLCIKKDTILIQVQKDFLKIDVDCDDLPNIVGVDKIINEEKIKLYPNPFTSNLNVDIIGVSFINLKIFDIQGMLIFNDGVKNNSVINTTCIKPGIYFAYFEPLNNSFLSPFVIKLVKL